MTQFIVTSEHYLWTSLHGLGLSSSSVRSCVQAIRSMLYSGKVPGNSQGDLEEIAFEALRIERAGAMFDIAAQDIYAVVFGCIRLITTASDHRPKVSLVTPAHPLLLPTHGFYAYFSSPDRHQSCITLESLLKRSNAARFLDRFSHLSLTSSKAIECGDIDLLVQSVHEYGVLYNAWAEAERMSVRALSLRDQFATSLKAKFSMTPIGAGFSDSFIFLGTDSNEVGTAFSLATNHGWIANSLNPASGIILSRSAECLVVQVPHRVDLIGGADLATNLRQCNAGICLSLAVNPVNTAIFNWSSHNGGH